MPTAREIMIAGAEWVTADVPVNEVARKDHAVRRLPVVDGRQLVGMVRQADIAWSMPDAKVGHLVGTISEPPPNN